MDREKFIRKNEIFGSPDARFSGCSEENIIDYLVGHEEVKRRPRTRRSRRRDGRGRREEATNRHPPVVVKIYITAAAAATFALEVEDATSEVLGSLYTRGAWLRPVARDCFFRASHIGSMHSVV